MQFQTSFAILHDIAHFECNDPSNPLACFLKENLIDIVDSQNKISEYINGLDLSAIVPDLDKINIKRAFSFPAPKNYAEIICEEIHKMRTVLSQHGHLVQTPGLSDTEREQILVLACYNYLRGQKAQILDNPIVVFTEFFNYR